MNGHPIKVLCGWQEMTIVMAEHNEAVPPNGAIPMYRQGGPRDGDLMGYVSLFDSPDDELRIVFHGYEALVTSDEVPVTGS